MPRAPTLSTMRARSMGEPTPRAIQMRAIKNCSSSPRVRVLARALDARSRRGARACAAPEIIAPSSALARASSSFSMYTGENGTDIQVIVQYKTNENTYSRSIGPRSAAKKSRVDDAASRDWWNSPSTLFAHTRARCG